jgi:hypothetical protein
MREKRALRDDGFRLALYYSIYGLFNDAVSSPVYDYMTSNVSQLVNNKLEITQAHTDPKTRKIARRKSFFLLSLNVWMNLKFALIQKKNSVDLVR